jgi:hypothetical protein
MVHRRELDGDTLVLGNQGDLYGNALTMWDHGTGSVWSQPTGEAILGPLAGARLELLPSTLTDWATWRRLHPNTTALDAAGGRSGFDVDRMLIAVEFGDDALAFGVDEVREVGVVNAAVGDIPIAVVAKPSAGGWWAVYSRQLDDRVVTLELDGDELVEVDGDARWDPVRGLPLEGAESLDPLGALTIFPADYPVHFPAGRVWAGEGQ